MRVVSNRRLLILARLFAVLAATWVVAVQFRHRSTHGHFAPLGLHADAVSKVASIGIPGQTHLYWAELTNFGWPVRFTACEYVTDALQPGTDYAYGIQRWDPGTKGWRTVTLPNPEWFCQPAALSKITADTRRRFIWPGQTVRIMDFEALGALRDFQKGDTARFVLFRSAASPPDWRTAISSPGFRIMDDAVDSPQYRIRH